MKRRQFITLAGGAVGAWPLAVRAQQSERVRRVGMLATRIEDDQEMRARISAFRQGLERLGWSEGYNVRIDYRAALGGIDQVQVLAKELVALQPDVIVTSTVNVTAAVQHESSAVPIVFTNVSDPIGSGFVTSLARPGGNLTGSLLYEASISGKWLTLLKEIAPSITRAALMANPKTTPFEYFLRAAEASAPALSIEVVPSPIESSSDIERAIESFARVPNGALVVLPSPFNGINAELIVETTAQNNLPAVYTGRYFITAGGLMSYDTDRNDGFRVAADYVNRILRGAKPADLPVQAPTKYELVINLKTAKGLGLEIPPTLLALADEVIE